MRSALITGASLRLAIQVAGSAVICLAVMLIGGCVEDACIDQACDSTEWLDVGLLEKEVIASLPGEPPCGLEYPVAFAGDGVLSADVRPGDLTIALVTFDGAIQLAEFGDAEAQRTLDGSALGVAWSNAGDRLAAARTTNTGTVLTILDAATDFRVSVEFSLDIDLPTGSGALRALAVSWSPDDTRVAVSPRFADAGGECGVLRLSDGATERFAPSEAFFLDDTRLVAVPGDAERAAEVTIGDGAILSTRLIDGALHVLDSQPGSGVFVTVQAQLSSKFSYPEVVWIRTLDDAPILGGNYYGQTVSIVPRAKATAGLVAAGIAETESGFVCPN